MGEICEVVAFVGSGIFLAQESSDGEYGTFFEEIDETGYFYAVDHGRSEKLILDALHIYTVANVLDRNRPSTFSIRWSSDSRKCALLINDYPHAVFDFIEKQGRCRTNFPNFSHSVKSNWNASNHEWSDDAVAWLYRS